MKGLRAVVLISVIFGIWSVSPVHAGLNEWTMIWPSLTQITDLVIDPSMPATLYAGTDVGVMKSKDGGDNWFAVNSGLNGRPISSLAIDPLTPTILYAGTNAGVFKSTDGGDSWFAVDNGLPKTADEGVIVVVTALAVDPSTPATLYAGTNSVGVYKSTDGGTSWFPANNGLPLITVWYPLHQDTAVENIPPYPVTFFAEIRALAIDPSSHTTLYAGIQDQGVFKSVDGGAKWTEMNTALTHLDVVALAIDPSTPTILYAGTVAGVFKYEASAGSIVADSGGGDSNSGCFIGALLY